MAWNSFDTKMAILLGSALAGMGILLAGCTPMGVATVGAVGTAVGVSASTVATATTVANDAYRAGQLFCQNKGVIQAVVSSETGQPFLVTGKPATVVADICSFVDPVAVPTPPPQVPTAVPAVALPGLPAS